MIRPRAAVVGSGVAGLTAAYLLQRRYDVTLFEADRRLGGHAHTHDIDRAAGGTVRVDTGFIVHNERTYPQLLRLFRELDVAMQESEMSMSVRCEGCGLEYAGARKLRGLFADPRNLSRPRYLRMLGEATRFHREARHVLAAEEDGSDELTLGRFLTDGGYSRYFVDHFMMPLVSAVWSTGPKVSAQQPARNLFRFFDHHGMLSIGGSPPWRTVVGGSRSYVDKVAERLSSVRVSTPVRTVSRGYEAVEIRDHADSLHLFDRVVIATHPDTALGILADPSLAQKEILGAFTYAPNEAWLHTDASVLPRRAGARASWNYLKATCSGQETRPLMSYDLNRLMRLGEPMDYVVTLNGTGRVAESSVIAKMSYEHPVFTPESVAAQRRLPEINDETLAFAGAYHGWGFHEDGCAAGVRAAASLGVQW
ncbi:MAG: FAD-dependent oxidoreductase [Actinomycetota bacterium]|nr:FAD-dependent oxidoreductase [Actinomycetota bacterium]